MNLGAAARLGVFALVASTSAPSAAAPCATNATGRIRLAATAVDPDVFIWDSRERLVRYAAGEWGNTRAIFSHTVLVKPGTDAVVVACPGDDAVGVRITTGPYKGRYGWILTSDVHRP